jgi:hypothetical protein
VRDAYNNLLPAGQSVTFSTNLGTLSATTVTTDASGFASVTLRGTVAGTATVSAKANTGTAKYATVALVADASTATVFGLSASPSSIVADGSAASTLTATVRDANSNLLPAGQVVYFNTNLGALSASSSSTDGNGSASVTLSGTAAGTATVTATTAAGRSGSVAVTLTSAAPTNLKVVQSAQGSIGGGCSSERDAQISWSGGNINGSTTYTLVMSTPIKNGSQQYQGNPNFTPPAGSTRFTIPLRSWQPTYFNEAYATLTACNGGSCTTAVGNMYYYYDTQCSN